MRKNGRQFSADEKLIISDGSPGIGCSVISSITGSDAVLVVTEPTKSGLEDLIRVVALCEHFGHCEGFTIYDVEDGKSLKKDFIPNPGHKPGFLPVFLHEKNVNVIIAGGMGEIAQELFKENQIEVIVGAEGLW